MLTFARWTLTIAAAAFGYVVYVYLTLPDVRFLATTNPTTTAFMELRAREAAADGQRFQLRTRWVPYGQISDNLKRAVLVAEDAAFFEHEGVDVEQLRASLERNWEEGRFVRGGSTITQQLAKNLYLSPSRNPVRKIKELLIARRLEAALTKRRILELYLNLIEWGDGIFGCEAASRAYFGKPASALGSSEAALLAGAIINPRELSPARPSGRLSRRQQIILRRMGIRPESEPVNLTIPGTDPTLLTPFDTTPPPPPRPPEWARSLLLPAARGRWANDFGTPGADSTL
jgi:monofunctional biosynthetic peptidoglycan transglycosylase